MSAAVTPPTREGSKVSCVESVGEFPLWPFPRSIGRGRDVPRCGMDEAILSRRLRVTCRRMGRRAVSGSMGRGDGSEIGTSAWSARGVLSVVGCEIDPRGRKEVPHLMASPLSSTSTSTSTSASSESDELGSRSSLSCERIVSKISSSPNSSASRGGAEEGRRVVSMSPRPLDAVISPAPRTGARRGRPSPFVALREYRPAPPGTDELPVRTARIDSRFEAVLRARLLARVRVCEFG